MKQMKGRFLSKFNLISTVNNTLRQNLKKNPTEKPSLQNLPTPPAVVIHHKQENTLQDDSNDIFQHVADREEDKEKVWHSHVYHHHIKDMDTNHKHEDDNEEEEEDYFPFSPKTKDSVVFYTTGLRGIRKTFEDCNTIRFLLESLKISYVEKDVSMHLEFREELWRFFGGKRVIPPKLFIRGRCVGGADEVVALHEKGELRRLLEGIPRKTSLNPCKGCGNKRFVVCSYCDGSRKVVEEGDNGEFFVRCHECNENGLIKCSICC